MRETEVRTALAGEMAGLYGLREGMRVSSVVLPAILGDFLKMVSAAPPGKQVSEEYKTEDRRAVIHLTGHRSGRETVFDEVRLNGKELRL